MRITAVCSQTCENGGSCVAPETCECANGWKGQDCTIPVCSLQCPSRSMCVAPDVCACIPGFTNDDLTQLMLRDQSLPSAPYTNHQTLENGRTLVNTHVVSETTTTCSRPLCVQTCVNGFCGLPDTCICDEGWFGTNCTVPVCSQTCGNGGNCTNKNTCKCSSNVSFHLSLCFSLRDPHHTLCSAFDPCSPHHIFCAHQNYSRKGMTVAHLFATKNVVKNSEHICGVGTFWDPDERLCKVNIVKILEACREGRSEIGFLCENQNKKIMW